MPIWSFLPSELIAMSLEVLWLYELCHLQYRFSFNSSAHKILCPYINQICWSFCKYSKIWSAFEVSKEYSNFSLSAFNNGQEYGLPFTISTVMISTSASSKTISYSFVPMIDTRCSPCPLLALFCSLSKMNYSTLMALKSTDRNHYNLEPPIFLLVNNACCPQP